MAITPDGNHLVSASEDKTLKIWDLLSGSELHTLSGHNDDVFAVAITPDGKQAISVSSNTTSWDTTFKIWEIEIGLELRTLNGSSKGVEAVAITPDGKRLVSIGRDGLKVWDWQSGEELRTLSRSTGYEQTFVITRDGTKVVSCSDSKTLKVWNLYSGEELLTLSGHTSYVWAWDITPDGNYVVSASDSLKIWDLQSGKVVASFKGDSEISACVVAPDGVTILVGEQSGKVHFLRFKTDDSGLLDEPVLGFGELQKAEELLSQGKKLLYRTGKYQDAIKEFDKAIELNHSLYEAWWLRGKTLSKLERYYDAYESFCKASKIVGLEHEDYYDIWLDITEATENFAGQIYNLALKTYREGNTQEALRLCNNILNFSYLSENIYSNAYCFRGYLYDELGDYLKAIEDYTEAICLNPNIEAYYRGRAISHNKVGDTQGAIEDFSQALQINPNDAEVYFKRALCYRIVDNYQMSVEDFTQAIALEPNDAEFYMNRCISLAAVEDGEGAIADFKKAEELFLNQGDIPGYQKLRNILKTLHYY